MVDEFCDDYIVPCVQADAVYENKYLLGTSMARPADRKEIGRDCQKRRRCCHLLTALPEKATTRFVSSWAIKALAPDLKIIAPWRLMTHGTCSPVKMKSHTARHMASIFRSPQIPATAVTVTCGTSAMKVLSLKIRANEPNYDHLLVLGVSPEKAPDEGEYVTMTFEKGVPDLP